MKMNTRKNRGITLVALVITIIILLILAGISIATLKGSGLFEKAKLAEQKSKEAQEQEEQTLGDYENKIGEYIGSARNGVKQKDSLLDTPVNSTGTYNLKGNVNSYDVLVIISKASGTHASDWILKELYSIENSLMRIGVCDSIDKNMNISFDNETLTIVNVYYNDISIEYIYGIKF